MRGYRQRGLSTTRVTVVLALVLVRPVRERRPLGSADSLLLVWALATGALVFQAFSLYRAQAALLLI